MAEPSAGGGAARPSPLPPGAVRQAFATTFLVYVATAAVFVASNHLVGHGRWWITLKVGVPMLLGDALLDVPLVLLTLAASQRGGRRRWVAVVALALAVALAQAVYDVAVRIAVGAIPAGTWERYASNALPIDLYDTGLLVALIAFQAAYNRAVAQQQALGELAARERRASLAALRLQLNPHFLFNTMNALSSLVVTRRNADAEAMIGELSDFLRHVLAIDPTSLDRLDHEFALTETYLAIEQIRFGERLAVTLDLPAALAATPVPPFLLQPLVENAIKYAVAPSPAPVTIRVAATVDAGVLRLEVADDGAGASVAGGTGVGLVNVRERLALHYGTAASLEAAPAAGGYRAVLRLPLAPTAV